MWNDNIRGRLRTVECWWDLVDASWIFVYLIVNELRWGGHASMSSLGRGCIVAESGSSRYFNLHFLLSVRGLWSIVHTVTGFIWTVFEWALQTTLWVWQAAANGCCSTPPGTPLHLRSLVSQWLEERIRCPPLLMHHPTIDANRACTSLFQCTFWLKSCTNATTFYYG